MSALESEVPGRARTPASARQDAPQRILKTRRDYNRWVANETLEDYALRFTPHSFRKWSIFRVSNTALGAISFLVLEAIGGTLAVNYGFVNAFWAIAVASMLIFLTSLPIAYYAARHGLDMDLLTRGAGFGYIGSTISSFIYATFTFILFALEAAIMAFALSLFIQLPLYVWYLFSALIVVPLVTHGVTLISRIQMLTQPLWVVLMLMPFLAILIKEPEAIEGLMRFAGESGYDSAFNLYMFGAALSVGMALIPQIGEQVDYLRFMPERSPENRWRWLAGVVLAGPGWILIGMLKMLFGALLAYMAIAAGRTVAEATNPTYMYYLGFDRVFDSAGLVLGVTVFFVVLSQIKINITNAYAGSLAWSNFFARLTHSHPGRVVWLVFNVAIATLLMLLDVSDALEQILGLYSNVAIAWITAVVADLVINKPLGLSPKGVEFRRAYLFDINPVGVGAMGIACVLSVAAHVGLLGLNAQTFSSFIAMVTALVASPVIAWLTGGKYYLARTPHQFTGAGNAIRCSICEQSYETDDVAMCPAYGGPICSLCCCLDARCDDACKPAGRLSEQIRSFTRWLLPSPIYRKLPTGLGLYAVLMVFTFVLLSSIFVLVYVHAQSAITDYAALVLPALRAGFIKAFTVLLLVGAVIVWWLVLNSQSRAVAQQESNNQNRLLQEEIRQHQITDIALQKARVAAEQANQAKSRYITGISHELRTPLNSILGYAQLMQQSATLSDRDRRAVQVVLRSGEHLLSLIEGTLDIAKIEGGKLEFDIKALRLPEFLTQIRGMFEIQAANKGVMLDWVTEGRLPDFVRADSKRLGQILINIIGNAVKYTREGSVRVEVRYAREFLAISVNDTGIGIGAEELPTLFEPFVRGRDHGSIGGTGLGLTISKLLTELMGGELQLQSTKGIGTQVNIRLFLPMVSDVSAEELEQPMIPMGYLGPRKRILVVDNEPVDRQFLVDVLSPLGFHVFDADSGVECLKVYRDLAPDLILLDLAMPEMDGWETCHRIRNMHHSTVPLAIISANAFDRDLENTAGIGPEDFFTKPLELAEFFVWLGRRLSITWVYGKVETPDVKLTEAQDDALDPALLGQLFDLADLGNVGEIRRLLNDVLDSGVVGSPLVLEMKRLLDALQLEALKARIGEQISDAQQ